MLLLDISYNYTSCFSHILPLLCCLRFLIITYCSCELFSFCAMLAVMHTVIHVRLLAQIHLHACLGFLLSFRSTITREKFEELCQDLWEKSLIPLKEVLKHSGLKVDELYAVELIGGATRVPKLQVCTILFV